MSDKKITRKEQLERIKTFNESYNSDGTRFLQQAQQQYNEELKKERESDHRSYKTIEAEATAILKKAHKEGEVHIREKHSKTPLIFYITQTADKVMRVYVWDKGIVYPVPVYKGGFGQIKNYLNIKASGFIKEEGDLGTVILSELETVQLIKEQKGQKFNLKRPSTRPVLRNFKYQYQLNEKNEHQLSCCQIDDRIYAAWDIELPQDGQTPLLLGDFYIYYPRTPEGSNDKDWRNVYNYIDFLIAPELNNKFSPVFTSYFGADNLFHCYSSVNQFIYKIITKAPAKTEVVLTSGETGNPIDLDYNPRHHSLLIQDEASRQIGVHLLDEPPIRNWRNMTITSYFPIPNGALTSSETFTISCLLLLDNIKNEERPNMQSNLKFWLQDEEFHFEYNESGKDIQTITFPKGKYIPDEKDPDWFQFTLQKEKNTFRFFVDGILIHRCAAPDTLDLTRGLNISCPGYMMCELRIWNIARTSKQLKTYKRTWLPVDQFEGLTGYWHFYVVGNPPTGLQYEYYNNKKLDLLQEPDLSGHGHHIATTSEGNDIQSGNLNYHTGSDGQAPSPFPKVIPLYNLNTIKQGLEIDRNTGKIYWIDQTKDGRFFMMCGSTLGHLPPIPLFEVNSLTKFSVLSQENSPYEDLILAHAERRKAMEEKFDAITSAHKTGHQDILDDHDTLQKSLIQSQKTYTDKEQTENEKEKAGTPNCSQDAYKRVHNQWLETVHQMHLEQEHLRQTAKKSRENELSKAKKQTDKAKQRVWEARKKYQKSK